MDKKTEALKLAEDALKRVRTQDMELVQLSMIALAAIREALAEQPAQQQYQSTADKCKLNPVPAKGGLLSAQQKSPSTRRWNIERDGDALLVCDGLHDKHEPCEYKRYVPEPAQQQEPVAFYVYKPTLPRGNLGSVSDGDLPWVYDQDPSSGFSARMLVTPITSPPASKPWVGLTDEDAQEVIEKSMHAITGGSNTFRISANTVWTAIVRSVEAKLREKNA